VKVLVTGATGFVAKTLIENLLFESFKLEVTWSNFLVQPS
jgi:nucleoside-diphosphate-sugar epimerase